MWQSVEESSGCNNIKGRNQTHRNKRKTTSCCSKKPCYYVNKNSFSQKLSKDLVRASLYFCPQLFWKWLVHRVQFVRVTPKHLHLRQLLNQYDTNICQSCKMMPDSRSASLISEDLCSGSEICCWQESKHTRRQHYYQEEEAFDLFSSQQVL